MSVLERTGELISTGEAARILGVSRQHVVNLCDRGDLAASLVGSHRRIKRDQVEAMASGYTREQVRSWRLGVATAAEFLLDPAVAVALARRNLETMRQAHGQRTGRWLEHWDRLLDTTTDEIVEMLVARTQHAAEMRQNSPFAGLIDDETRLASLHGGRR